MPSRKFTGLAVSDKMSSSPDDGTAIAFQINTDIVIIGEERPVVLEIENRLAALAFSDAFAPQPVAVTRE